jgi:hypothetical protein
MCTIARLTSPYAQGASSIAFHLTSNASWPYFHQAILESHPAAIPFFDLTSGF